MTSDKEQDFLNSPIGLAIAYLYGGAYEALEVFRLADAFAKAKEIGHEEAAATQMNNFFDQAVAEVEIEDR